MKITIDLSEDDFKDLGELCAAVGQGGPETIVAMIQNCARMLREAGPRVDPKEATEAATKAVYNAAKGILAAALNDPTFKKKAIEEMMAKFTGRTVGE
jgi:hypothetical protein